MIILYFDLPRYANALRSRGLDYKDSKTLFSHWEPDPWRGLWNTSRIQYDENYTQQLMAQNQAFENWLRYGHRSVAKVSTTSQTGLQQSIQVTRSSGALEPETLETPAQPKRVIESPRQDTAVHLSPDGSDDESTHTGSMVSATKAVKSSKSNRRTPKRIGQLICERCKLKNKRRCDKRIPCNNCTEAGLGSECKARYKDSEPKEPRKRAKKQQTENGNTTDEVNTADTATAYRDASELAVPSSSISKQVERLEDVIRQSRGQTAPVTGMNTPSSNRDDVPVVTHSDQTKHKPLAGLNAQRPLPTLDPATMNNQDWLQIHNVR